ncbi:Trypsin-like serine protease [Homalodisca vitripennis]|nr:Trypsin-like serine protease [Homalodisca vitripennis]
MLMTRSQEDIPGAILTISKNVLGRNVTNSIAPLVRVLPIGTENAPSGMRTCTTPGGQTGHCEDLSNCPQLLLDLGNLRQSICFKSLFVPGVCCPRRGEDSTFLQEVSTTTRRPVILTSKIPLQTAPTQATYTTTSTTQRPNSIDYDFNSGECGQQDVPKFRVVGGEEALPGRWPWMAAIFLHGPRRTEFWCGGSLIGSRHILTAAHCTKDTRQRPFQARQFTVRLGDIDLRREDEPSSPQTYRVAEVRAHPRFSRVGFYNDIAVLVLDRAVRKSRYIIPVCLPAPSYRFNRFVGEQPTVVGWGTTYYGGKESTVQRQVALPVWKNEDCDKTYFQPINENFICAGLKEGGKDACQGDSGGPLVLKKNGRWMQIGIVSFGNKCGEPGYPGVYTRVTQYLDWINSNT